MTMSRKQSEMMKQKVPWYHGNLTRHAAEVLLINNGQEGSFLLRNVTDGDFSVSVRGKSDVKHFKLEYDGAMFHFGLQDFDSISNLVSYFANQPMVGTRRTTMGINLEYGTLYTLKHPYPYNVPEPEGFDSCLQQTAKEQNKKFRIFRFDEIRMQSTVSTNADMSSLQLRLTATPIASKSGYLAKQGGSVKSWKRRWFVCMGNKLAYFEDKNSSKAIFTIDLLEARACYKTEQPGLQYCFSLECRERTWHFSADFEEDAANWTRLLNWKMKCNRP